MTYPINFWYGIPKAFISRERLAEAAEAGFTIIECRYDTETNKQVLSFCEELGLKAYLWDDRMYAAISGSDGWEARLDSMFAEYRDYPALDRYFIKDEPIAEHFPMLQRIADYITAHDPAHGFYINLLPNVAMPQGETYETHVEQFLQMVKPTLLSYDHYCMKKREVSAEERAKIPAFLEARVSGACRERNNTQSVIYEEMTTPAYFDNLELIRRKAREHGIDWMIIILLSEHWHYRQLTEAEIRWEVFTALAYGSSQLSYFTYWTPGVNHSEPWSYHHALIEADGTRDENYAIVKRINREIQAVMGALDGAASTAVYHVGAETDTLCIPFTAYNDILDISGGRFVAGFFADGKFILANKDFHNSATARIRSEKPLLQFSKARNTWDALPQKDGVTAVFLSSGDGELLRTAE